MTKKQHAELLRDFFTAIFPPDERVSIFVALSDDKFQKYLGDLKKLPNKLHGRDLLYFPTEDATEKELKPCHVLSPFSRLARSKDERLIEKLWDFSRLGYEIYFCANPLTCDKRWQTTVHTAHNIVIESDDDSVDAQRKTLEKHPDLVRAAVFTGNKSIHAYVRLEPPLRNRHVIGWKQSRKSNNRKCDWSDYRAAAAHLIQIFKDEGLSVDTKVANDWTRLTRVPGFPHSKTGIAELLWINRDASYDTTSVTNRVMLDLLEPVLNPTANLNSQWIEWASDPASPVIKASNPVSPPALSVVPTSIIPSLPDSKHDDVPSVHPSALRAPVCASVGSHLTDVKHRGTGRTFLDEMETYEDLQKTGVPGRGQRRKYHRTMAVVGKVFAWSDNGTADAWRKILIIRPENIGGSVDAAVNDLKDFLRHKTHTKPYISNLTALPAITIGSGSRGEIFNIFNSSADTPNRTNIIRLIERVLLPKVRTFPFKCLKGTLGIKATEMLGVCVRGKYRPALDWLIGQNIVTQTSRSYLVGKKTMTYRINVPLLLYWLGFKTADLDWNVIPKPNRRSSGT